MSLMGAMNVGKSALATHQAALQVTSNNIANAGNADYTRQTGVVQTSKDLEYRPGVFMGTGVNLTGVVRQIDEALTSRLRSSVSDTKSTGTLEQWMGRIETVFNELSDEDLSTQMSKFFNAWSNLANKPHDTGLRQVVIQTGQAVANWMQSVRTDFTNLQVDVDSRLAAKTADADRIAQQVADLNAQIVKAEGGSAGQANNLRDQRDQMLKQLAELVNIKTVEQPSGMVDVYVGSEPLITGTTNRGVDLRKETVDGELKTTVIFKADRGALKLTSGEIGALQDVRTTHLETVIDKMDELAGSLIFELNKIHSGGQGLQGFSSVTATTSVANATVALTDTRADLDFAPRNGSFVVHVKNKTTGLTTSTLVQVDLDGSGADTSLNSLTADIDGISDINATVNAGKMTVTADSANVEISFSQDSSGVLAALGVNNFFTGSNARDIKVNEVVTKNPSLIAAAKNGDSGDNKTARAIAALESAGIKSLNGANLKETYQSMVNNVAVTADASRTNAEAASSVQETLEAQRQSLSGVSLDEEAINLIRQQRAFQGAAKLISAVDEMLKTVLSLV